MKIYVASSWRNIRQSEIVQMLRDEGYDVYDFRNPAKDDCGFSWSEIDPSWLCWDARSFRRGLAHPAAERGFAFDMSALDECEVLVLVLPCGRSAHLEAGYARGRGKIVVALLDDKPEAELMYKMFDGVAIDNLELLDMVDELWCRRERQKRLKP